MRIAIVLFACLFVSDVSLAKDKVLATVNSKKIMKSDFDKKYKTVVDSTINPPSKEQFLEDLVRFEVGVQEAKKQKIISNPTVQEEIDKLTYRWLLEKELSKYSKGLKVTKTDMANYYRSNPEIKTSHILIEVNHNASNKQKAAAQARAKKILAQVKSSKKSFSSLVKLYTDDVPTKNTGGDLGWQSKSNMLPTYYKAAVKLKNGGVSDLVRTKYGYHIIKLTGKKPYKNANKRQVKFDVFEQKRKLLFDKYFAKLKKKYKIKKYSL